MEQHGFSLVVRGMAQCHTRCTFGFRYRRQERVAHLPGGLLEGRDTPLLLMHDWVLLVGAAGQPKGICKTLNESGIVVRFGPSEVMIEMGHMQIQRIVLTQFVEAAQKGS